MAQDADSGQLEEIVVTATRRELNLQKVAQSVSAFSSADIERQKFRSVEDVVGALPSVSLTNNQPGRNEIVIRGITSGSDEFYTDSQVSVYLDDQPMTSSSQQVEVRLIDIERIEALPGPQGTLFGSSSQAGTLVYVTNKPDPTGFSAQFDGEIGTTKGGEESYDVSGHVNFPIADNFAVRAVGFFSEEGGYVDNVFGPTLMGDSDNAALVEEDFNDYSIYGGRIAARWQINPEWESTLSLITQSSEADGSWESDPALGDYKITRFFGEWREDDWYQTSLNVKGDLGFAQLSLTGSYFDRDIKYEWDNANYSQWRSAYYGAFGDPSDPAGSVNVYNTGFGIGNEFNWQEQARWAYEARLTSLGESRFQWMVGAFYEDVWDWWHYGAVVPGLTNTLAWEAAQYYACYVGPAQGYDAACPVPDTDLYYSQVFERTVKQTAIFGELTFDLTDKWSVTGGARWFEYDREEFQSYNIPQGLPALTDDGPDFVGNSEQRKTGKDSDTVFKFSTEYRFDEDRMIYALYSEGFRLGGSNSTRAAESGVIPLEYRPGYAQELRGRPQEHVVRRFAASQRLALLHGVGRHPAEHVGQRLGQPVVDARSFNGGKAEQKGAEIITSWKVTENFSIDVSAFFADPEFTEDTFFPNGELAIGKGLPMPISPDRKYWLAAGYTFPKFTNLSGDFWTRASYTYQSEIWNSNDAVFCFNFPEECVDEEDRDDPDIVAAEKADRGDQLIPSWTTTTLQFGFTHDNGWEVALIARNLFDESNTNWLSESDYSSTPLLDPDNGWGWNDGRFRFIRTLQKPRSIYLSFTKKW